MDLSRATHTDLAFRMSCVRSRPNLIHHWATLMVRFENSINIVAALGLATAPHLDSTTTGKAQREHITSAIPL